MPNYQEQKTMSEVLLERRAVYEGMVQQALDGVYQSVDLRRLEEFETALAVLCGSTGACLESRVSQENQTKPSESADRKPRLTSYQYNKARDAGMTNQQIKAKFKLDSPYQLRGLGRSYASRKAKPSEETSTEAIELNEDKRKVLTWNKYIAARDCGETNADIGKKYKREYPRQLNVFSMQYAKQKRTESDRNKPQLTYELYAAAKDAGQTNNQIREQYRLQTGLQLNGFAGNYSKKKAQEKKSEAK